MGHLLAVALIIAVSLSSAKAEPITFVFEGVGLITACDPVCESLFGSPNPGALPFSGIYTFDSQAPDLAPLNPNVGVYLSSGPPFGASWSFGPFTGASDSVLISVLNDVPFPTPSGLQDRYLVDGGGLRIFLHDCHGGSLDSDELPLSPPSLFAFHPGCAPADEIVLTSPDRLQVLGVLTRLERVPEPGTLWLVAAALLCWIVIWRTSRGDTRRSDQTRRR